MSTQNYLNNENDSDSANEESVATVERTSGQDQPTSTDRSDLHCRQFQVRQKQGQLTGVAATEQPTPMLDIERMEFIDEVLLMSGMESFERLPLLDSHNRFSVNDVKGSVVNPQVKNGRLIVDINVASSDAEIEAKIREGHLTDLSVGYNINESVFVPEGQTQRINGKSFEGPVTVVTNWSAREVSLTPIGADDLAKIRSYGGLVNKVSQTQETEEVREDGNVEVQEVESAEEETSETRQEPNEIQTREHTEETEQRDAPETPNVQAEVDKALKAERKRQRDIRAECHRTGLDKHADELIERCGTVEEARKEILDLVASKQAKVGYDPISFGRSETEKRHEAMVAGLRCRAGTIKRDEKLPEGARDFVHASLLDLARESLEYAGVRTRGMTKQEIAKRALMTRTDYCYHTTGDFPNLMADVSNKTLLDAYNEANTKWRILFRQAASVPDFKNINRVRLSEAPQLDVWPDNTEPNQVELSDTKAQYAIEAYSDIISYSWRSIVNDDLDALNRTIGLMGAAASRTVEATVFSLINDNVTVDEDDKALFHADHNNLVSSGSGAPSTSQVSSMRKLLRKQTGLNGEKIGVEPRFLVGPVALEQELQEIANSAFRPDSTNGTPQVVNTFSSLQVVTSPYLDDGDDTHYFLMADSSQIDTIEVSFLQGQETPEMDQWVDPKTGAQNFRITQSFGAKAVDHRGMVRNNGA